MIGTAERCFEVTQQRVDRAELFELDAGHPAAGDGALMAGTYRGDAREASQPVLLLRVKPASSSIGSPET